jgi:hypothetical protein
VWCPYLTENIRLGCDSNNINHSLLAILGSGKVFGGKQISLGIKVTEKNVVNFDASSTSRSPWWS